MFGISAAFAQLDPVRPAATSEVGPWEAVVWARGRKVDRCTLARAKPTADGVSYGFLVDHEVLFGVESRQWAFAPKARLQPTLTLQNGETRKFPAQAVSATRANITFPRRMLDQLQRSEHLDLQIGGTKVRLPFDDFNAARVVLEICVQKLGKDYETGR